MPYAHFLGHVDDDCWLGDVRQFILLGFGPVSRAYVQQYRQDLQATPHQAFLLDAARLHDFTLRGVDMDALQARHGLQDFYETIRGRAHPAPVPAALLKRVAALADDEAVRLDCLALLRGGGLALSVCAPALFRGRAFPVTGRIALGEPPAVACAACAAAGA